MFNMGPMEIAVIMIVALLVVGPKRLPEIGKTIGRSLRDFKRVQEDLKSSIDLGLDDDTARPSFERPPATDPSMSRERRHRRHHDDEDQDEGEKDEGEKDEGDEAAEDPAEELAGGVVAESDADEVHPDGATSDGVAPTG